VSDKDISSSQPKVTISIAQKIGIFFLIPVFVVIMGFITYDMQLVSPKVFAAAVIIIFLAFPTTVYLFIRRLVMKEYTAYKRMELMIITDELTQLFTKNHFNDLFKKELARAIRYEKILCCAVIEIDGYNEIKIKYGTQFSDEILQDAAESLKDNMRVIDILAREDDRFICLLPETDIKSALFVLKRLRSLIEGGTFDTEGDDGPINITISIGITASNPSSDGEVDIHNIIDIADKALAIATEKGGNTVESLNIKSQAAQLSIQP